MNNKDINYYLSINLNEICRVCLQKSCSSKELISIFNTDEKSIVEMIKACASVEIDEIDGLPSNICKKCFISARTAYGFKIQCELSDKHLRQLLSTKQLDVKSDKEQSKTSEISILHSLLLGDPNATKILTLDTRNTDVILNVNAEQSYVIENYPQNDIIYSTPVNIKDISNTETELKSTNYFSIEASGSKSFNESITNIISLESNLQSEIEISKKIEFNQDKDKIQDEKYFISINNECDLKDDKNQLQSDDSIFRLNDDNHINDSDLNECYQSFRSIQNQQNDDIKIEKSLEYPNTDQTSLDNYNFDNEFIVLNKKEDLSDISKRSETIKKKKSIVSKGSGSKKKADKIQTTKLNSGIVLPKHQCESCGKVFNSRQSLIQHNRIHTGERPYVCHLCDKSFTNGGHLHTHMRTHTGEKKHHCNSCPKSFATAQQLNKHVIAIHTKERPYGCPFCPKRCASSSNLQTHVRIHTGEKNHVCDRCSKAFSTKGQLQQHLLVHTGDKPYVCTHCGKRFTQRAHLKRHYKIHRNIVTC